jgi:hypothetical protein
VTGTTGWRKATASDLGQLLESYARGQPSKNPMTKRELKSQPTWTDVKAKLAAFDRTAFLDLLHHLYAAHTDNQAFLHARFGLGEDVCWSPERRIGCNDLRLSSS